MTVQYVLSQLCKRASRNTVDWTQMQTLAAEQVQ